MARLVTVLGGGQLGLMLGLAGIPMGLRFRFLDPSAEAPAGAVGDLVVGSLADLQAVDRAAVGADVVTYEWEGVPAASARHLAGRVGVAPPPRALEVSQDRLAEKQAFRSLQIPTADFLAVDDRSGLDAAVERLGFPTVIKTRRGGYDGKGQAVLREASDLEPAWRLLGAHPLLAEANVPFDRELSVLAVRDGTGATACWPVVENHHRAGILRLTRAPAPGHDASLQGRAEACIVPLLEELEYVGVCCVELFDTGGALSANEFAPRVHNSGHWTIEGSTTSQFENHLRAVLGLRLGSTDALGACAMVNCIGAMPDVDAILAIEGAHLHDYAKQARPGRKLGHITVTGPDTATLETRLERVLTLVQDR